MNAAAQAEMLANRLTKRQRHLARWAKREGTTAYRLYDRDIPEVPLAIDWYAGCLHLAEYARGRDDDDDGAWLEQMRAAAAGALGVALDDTAVKRREKRRGGAGYERPAPRGRRVAVVEGGHRFWVNLWDYLDTGLFLDHRITRRLVGESARDKRVLNLFSYTGSFGVYAAAGGAREVVQVDLSKTYLDWAEDNLVLNELPVERGALVHGDVPAFLEDAARQGRRFDLVVVDPPTFSTSKRMEGTFDVVRDHPALLARVRAVTAPGGVVWFSTNARGFRLSDEAVALFGSAVDETERTRPYDFEGRHSHRAFRLSDTPPASSPR